MLEPQNPGRSARWCGRAWIMGGIYDNSKVSHLWRRIRIFENSAPAWDTAEQSPQFLMASQALHQDELAFIIFRFICPIIRISHQSNNARTLFLPEPVEPLHSGYETSLMIILRFNGSHKWSYRYVWKGISNYVALVTVKMSITILAKHQLSVHNDMLLANSRS